MRKKIAAGCLMVALLLSGCEGRFTPAVFVTTQEVENGQPQSVEVESEVTVIAEEQPEEPVPDLHPYDFTLAFAGDVNLAENWNTMDYYRQQDNGIYGCIDPALIQMMQDADLMCLNMEFCLSSVGSPMEGKAYTFRADPYRVQILEELSVDLVNLANNHVYDYGEEAFLDMLSLLKGFNLPYMGAGVDAKEAEAPYYIELDGKKIAIVAATRAEKYILTPEATESSPGVFRCYDRTRLLEVVQEADVNADFVIAYIHWGTEYSEVLEEAQTEGARELVEAGADVVLGAHPHCLQGVEFIDSVPVLYSLGNYWFNEKTLDSVLVKLHFYGDDEEQHLDTVLVPARQENHYTRLLTEQEEVQRWNEHLVQMSPGQVQIDEDGRLTERN